MKMRAPAHIAHFNVDNVEYTRNEEGFFEVKDDHVATALILGIVPYDPATPPVDFEADPRDAEIAELRARLALAESAAATPPAPPAPEQPADAQSDTSPPAGGTSETGDKMAAALALNPNFDEMGRDDMVEWLKDVGVVVPANISKVDARKAVDEAVADYQSGKKD
jgi:hypothetical protein